MLSVRFLTCPPFQCLLLLGSHSIACVAWVSAMSGGVMQLLRDVNSMWKAQQHHSSRRRLVRPTLTQVDTLRLPLADAYLSLDVTLTMTFTAQRVTQLEKSIEHEPTYAHCIRHRLLHQSVKRLDSSPRVLSPLATQLLPLCPPLTRRQLPRPSPRRRNEPVVPPRLSPLAPSSSPPCSTTAMQPSPTTTHYPPHCPSLHRRSLPCSGRTGRCHSRRRLC